MNSLIVGVKKFFKNKNTVTIIGLVAALGFLYFAYNWRIERKTQPVVVPYATAAIGPRTYISDEMVSTKKVPGGIVNSDVILNKSEIIGRYVNKDAVIPTNGLFYRSTVVKWEEISDTIYSDIPDNHTIVNLEVNQNMTYGNSIFPGNYIDLYYRIVDDTSGKITIGKFIESIRVLAVTDNNGQNIFETKDTPVAPKYLIFSVDEDLHLLLKKAIYLGNRTEIFPVPRNAAYSKNPKDTKVVNSYIQKYIEDKYKEMGGTN